MVVFLGLVIANLGCVLCRLKLEWRKQKKTIP